MGRDLKIRIANLQDAPALLKIYAPYVEQTAVTFEYEVPSLQEFIGRMANTLKAYPYLTAELDGRIVGYTYAGPFHERAAYRFAAETSIYVEKGQKRMGVGRALYEALEKMLAAQNILNLNACIAYPQTEDAYLTQDSVKFHQHMGFRLVGEFYQCGYKFGRWYNMVWMEKHIGEHKGVPSSVRPFAEIKELFF